ncbi:methyltransferase [Aquimarina sp. AD10]|uniref:methyltransferase n=1 Tax=Aquimarina sp. AD10 TaxID=1714849 RepID=UPI000E53A8B7|nr:methyltransferase [Aquimarina sp. AD10]AXT63045.1 methyltransferase [Aquimarina sp. AD10]RKM96846.1 methyltransferase [Aquimarina sp. AD10]
MKESKTVTKKQLTPSKIMQVGLGFWASKTLLSAVNMGLFTLLAEEEELAGQNIKEKLGLHDRGLYDFLDTLVALNFLQRTGLKESSIYTNTEETNLFLDKNKPSYVGGMLELSNNRLYGFWNTLEEGLKTGIPQNEIKNGGAPIFEDIYADQQKLKEFLKAMEGLQSSNFKMLSQKFDFSNYKTHCDIGGSSGHLAVEVVQNNNHIKSITFDLPPLEILAKENILANGLSDSISVKSGNFFKDEFPQSDVITMGNILHNWGLQGKKTLIKKAYDALPSAGALIVIENIIDDDRRTNAFGLMMSLQMLMETPEGFDFTAADFNLWASEIGFSQVSTMNLTGNTSAVIAIK